MSYHTHMSTTAIDALNIALMLGSAALAFFFPFELFLFSYAILGPLHYLTQISWLHKKQYFSGKSYDYLLLITGTVLVLIFSFLHLQTLAASTLFITFMAALIMVTVKELDRRIVLLALTVVAALLLQTSYAFILVFFLLLPTLIHVFLFTVAFILHGALKNKSIVGYLSLIVFLGCAVFLWLVQSDSYTITSYTQSTYRLFESMNVALMQVLGFGGSALYTSKIGLAIMSVIAFSYTYHYLNWFSKTNVIRWHQVPRVQLAVVILLWIGSVGLYLYDYATGLFVLITLSLLHVVLEFPLNHRTFIGIGTELRSRFVPK
jgi:hypothetical protein